MLCLCSGSSGCVCVCVCLKMAFSLLILIRCAIDFSANTNDLFLHISCDFSQFRQHDLYLIFLYNLSFLNSEENALWPVSSLHM